MLYKVMFKEHGLIDSYFQVMIKDTIRFKERAEM
jgi:hypothetical protein